MVCHARSASLSARRRRLHNLRGAPLPPLAVLDLNKPAEREAHEFLRRATSKRDRLWRLLDMRRQASTLLCVVRWVYPEDDAKPFSLAEVSLTETAVCWRYYATAGAARAEMEQRCADALQPDTSA